MTSPASSLRAGDTIMLADDRRKQFIFRLEPDAELQTHQGVLRHNDLIGKPWGARVATHLGHGFTVLVPTFYDRLLHIRRQSQIIFPKELGFILLHLAVEGGSTIIEAGSGSGALTVALAWAVGPSGRVVSYDRRADLQDLARRNVERFHLESRVTFRQKDIGDGFDEADVSALFLDIPDPHLYMPQVRSALRPGAPFGAILPTANQVSALVEALDQHHFTWVEVSELLLRFYKPVPARLRPTDRMVAHTGYLVFARPVAEGATIGGRASLPEQGDGEGTDEP